MESLQKNILIKQGDNFRTADLRLGVKKIKELPGIKSISFEDKKLSIQYDPYSVSKAYLVEHLSEIGFTPLQEAKKGFWARWIDKLAKNNQKNFGNERLDCCNIK